MLRRLGLASAVFAGLGSTAPAQDVWITPDMPSRQIVLPDQTLIISRKQDPQNVVSREYAKTSRACPPFCITPVTAAPGIVTIAELEVIAFLERSVGRGNGLLIDARLPEFYQGGTLPGARNLPFNALEPDAERHAENLASLGATMTDNGWSFTTAKSLVLFSGGPWDGQAVHALRSLVDAGYPTEKLMFYRGGMQMWHLLGLTPQYP